MSIPPLVCSTPPPPDQCEDDKDPEDFDIQYNLSQEDDDDSFEFGSFSTYNNFQTSQTRNDPIIIKSAENKTLSNSTRETEDNIENDKTTITTENKSKLEEETNIEDLHLEDLKVDQDLIESASNADTNTESKQSNPPVDSSKNNEISENVRDLNCSDFTHATPIQADEFDIEPSSIDQAEEPPSYVDEIIAAVDDLQITPTVPELPLDDAENYDPIYKPKIPIPEEQDTPVTSDTKTISKPEDNIVDDFGDFEDFQFTSPGDKPITADSCVNPWDNNNDSSGNDFGNFKADFDNNESNTVAWCFENAENSEEPCKVLTEENPEQNISALTCNSDDDDFGDFNDFQSSSAEVKLSAENEESYDYPILNLKQPDKLMENINSVINSVFEEEIPEPEEEFQEKLDTELGPIWGFLLQTDERQPYMVNWNNSLGQKTLLKALCIDSRNILFGPKWNYNMPKYAATLSAAPLQPQKQLSSPNTSQAEVANVEKSTSKQESWADPFSAEGQESCNADVPIESQVLETGPTDLDVFEASTSSKPDKIFSSTLNVQPLRQISLPDTHIFTPTDSETPRSTTIHYDSGPTGLLPQTVIETSKNETSFKSETHTLSCNPTSAADSDEYWEFQDFKGPSNNIKTTASIASQKSEMPIVNLSIGYATQVLQPVKVEPITPKLNWPDPGEVKETFDDFSDFVSNSALSNPQPQTPTVPTQKIDSKPTIESTNSDIAGPSCKVGNALSGDDDFDTFQSANPTSSVDINFTSVSNTNTAGGTHHDVMRHTITSPQAPTQTMTDFDFAFPRLENVKANTISIENVNKPKDLFVKNQTTAFPSSIEVKSPPAHASGSGTSIGLLQPIPATTSGMVPSRQKSGQILQPLSLESFSQINWPNPGIDLQDLSRFNPVETLNSLKSDLSVNSQSKVASPVHGQKNAKGAGSSQPADDDWGDFVSSTPAPATAPHPHSMPKKQTTFAEDDEWTDFVSSPSVKPQNGLNTISLNVHTNFQSKPSKYSKGSKVPLEIPSLNYITPKSTNHKAYNDRHFQNL